MVVFLGVRHGYKTWRVRLERRGSRGDMVGVKVQWHAMPLMAWSGTGELGRSNGLRGDTRYYVGSMSIRVRPKNTAQIVFATFAKIVHIRCLLKWPKETLK